MVELLADAGYGNFEQAENCQQLLAQAQVLSGKEQQIEGPLGMTRRLFSTVNQR